MRDLKNILGILVFIFMLSSVPILAADKDQKGSPQAAATQPSRQSMIEMHQKMAAMHAKMAACLQSEKSMSECRQEMMKDWPTGMGGRGMMKDGCPMMDQWDGKGK
jgi:hypothetical protein